MALVMVQGHVCDLLLVGAGARARGLYQLQIIFHGSTAPGFLFASGFVAGLPRAPLSPRAALRRARRLLFVLAVGYWLQLPYFSLGKTLAATPRREGRALRLRRAPGHRGDPAPGARAAARWPRAVDRGHGRPRPSWSSPPAPSSGRAGSPRACLPLSLPTWTSGRARPSRSFPTPPSCSRAPWRERPSAARRRRSGTGGETRGRARFLGLGRASPCSLGAGWTSGRSPPPTCCCASRGSAPPACARGGGWRSRGLPGHAAPGPPGPRDPARLRPAPVLLFGGVLFGASPLLRPCRPAFFPRGPRYPRR